jgi:integrase
MSSDLQAQTHNSLAQRVKHSPNRANSPVLPENTTDKDIIGIWLSTKLNLSPQTRDQYYMEARRAFWYAENVAHKTISDWTTPDLSQYLEFLTDPPAAMCGRRGVKRESAEWKPITGPLAKNSRKQTETILQTLFAWMVNIRYIHVSPFTGIAKTKKRKRAGCERYLNLEQCEAVKQTIDRLPEETQSEKLRKARDRFLFLFLVRCGVRTSEALKAKMCDFERIEDRVSGQKIWRFKVKHGKGEKERYVPADDVIDELVRYRLAFGMSPYPLKNEIDPLILSVYRSFSNPSGKAKQHQGARKGVTNRSHLYRILKKLFADTSTHLINIGNLEQAVNFGDASTHWLRHSYGTFLAAELPLHMVSDLMGHESTDTTKVYAHTDFIDAALRSRGKIRV